MGDKAPVPDPKVSTLPFKPPEIDWSSPNLCSQFNTKEAKVSAILNWLRDNAYEIHSNFNSAAPADKF